jgi:cytochrome P450
MAMKDSININRIPDETARAIVDPAAYAEWDSLHRKLVALRRDHPFARGELDGYDPFWVAAKYEDIQTVARRNDVFLSGVRALEPSKVLKAIEAMGGPARSVVEMNEPEHRKHRLLTQAWFQPKNIRYLEDRFRTVARRHVDRLADSGGECDFATVAGVHYPLLVIMSILGIPDQDEEMILRIAQEVLAPDDPDFGRTRGRLMDPEERARTARAVREDASAYFRELSAARKHHPSDDLATVIANAVIDGEPITDVNALGYYLTIITAGHDTTSSSMAGAVWALAERPAELAKVKDDLGLIPNLVDEAVRWTTPVHQFTRTAACDFEVRGQHITKGDRVILLFPSGNRDEDIFEDPFVFKVDRATNKQIGFGYGAHMCLGMHLARMEMRIFFEEMLLRLTHLELAGEPRRTFTNFVGGPKSVPIRYRIN